MRLPQDRILHINTELEGGKVNIVAEWQGELVWCKDCKHRRTDDCPMYWMEWVIHTDNDYIVYDYTTDDGYCHYGERKGGEDE